MHDKCSSTEILSCHPLTLLPLPKYAHKNQNVVGVEKMVKYDFTKISFFLLGILHF